MSRYGFCSSTFLRTARSIRIRPQRSGPQSAMAPNNDGPCWAPGCNGNEVGSIGKASACFSHSGAYSNATAGPRAAACSLPTSKVC